MSPAKLEVGNTLEAIRAEFLRHRGLILQMTLLFSVLAGLSSLIRVADPFGFAIGTGLTILLGAIFSGLMTSLICVNQGATGMGDLWPTVKPVLARLIWLTLLVTAGVFLGLFAFILPGIFLATFWAVAGQSLLVERRGVFESLGRSFDLVRGSAWQVFGTLAVLGLICILLLLLVLLVTSPLGTGPVANAIGAALGNFFSAPVFAVGVAVLYNHLAELKQPLATEETDEPGLPPGPERE